MADGPWNDYQSSDTSGPWDDFKTTSNDSTLKEIVGPVVAARDMALAIPKTFAQVALAGAARGVGAFTGSKATLADTWKTAGEMIDEAAPSLGQKTGMQDTTSYTAPQLPFEKYQQGVNWVANQIPNQDVAGAVQIGSNFLPLGAAFKGAGKLKKLKRVKAEDIPSTGSKAVDDLDAEQTAQEATTTPADAEAGPWDDYSDTQGNAAMRQTTETLNPGAPSPEAGETLPSTTPAPWNTTVDQLGQTADQNKYSAAQASIDARQKVMEQQMAQQQSLSFNAAERVRREQAPTGYGTWLQDQAQSKLLSTRTGDPIADINQQLSGGAKLPPEAPIPETPNPGINNVVNPDPAIQRGYALDSQKLLNEQAMDKATSGIEPNQVPPDAVIPRDSPRAGLTVPRDVNPRFVTDENGIPVRQGMPQPGEDVNLSTPETVNGILGQDTGARNDLGNAIQEANGPKLGPNEPFGAGRLEGPMGSTEMNMDGEAKTVSPEFNTTINRIKASGPRSNQKGMLDTSAFRDIGKMIARVAKAGADLLDKKVTQFENASRRPLSDFIGRLPQDVVQDTPGIKDSVDGIILKPDPGATFLAKALAETPNDAALKDFRPLKGVPLLGRLGIDPKNWQSGAIMAGEKFKSNALQGVGQWLHWMTRANDFRIKTSVKPLEGQLAGMTRNDVIDLHQLAMKELARGSQYDPALVEKHLGAKKAQFFTAFRKAMDDQYDQEMAQRQRLGLPAVTKDQAYYASLRHGDWQQSFYDKDGKLVYHNSSTTQMAATKATAWVKEKFGDKIDWQRSGTEAKYVGSNAPTGLPKDIIGTWQEMGKLFGDSEVGTLIQDTINKYNEDKGINFKNHDERFMNKGKVPGFEGDKPWLEPKENAHAFWTAQMGRLKNGFQWGHMLEVLNEIKPILSNPELLQKQPHIMNYAQQLISKEMGIRGNMLNHLENSLAKTLGVSRSTLYHSAASLKTGTYLAQLSASPGYMLATPFQGLLAPAMHAYMSSKGFKHNPFVTWGKTAVDASAAIIRHSLYDMSGKNVHVPWMSELGKRAQEYMENNGVADKNITDEYKHLGTNKIIGAVKNVLGPTITAPEKMGRMAVFMSMVHHLADERNGMSEADIFRTAHHFTDHTMTDMTHPARPMIVDKFGAAGELSYMYHSFQFNEAHQLSLFGRQFKETGNPIPLALHLGALGFMGGALAIPMVNELDGFWNLIKDGISQWFPEHYSKVAGIGLKGWILQHLPNLLAQGTISAVTGAALSNRFSPNFIDPEHPFSQMAAPIQEGKELASSIGALAHPTKRNAEQAAYMQVPPLMKGQMTAHLDDFKNKNPTNATGRNPDSTMSYRNPNNINDTQTVMKRTANDEKYSSLGMQSTAEFKIKGLRYANNDEQKRQLAAFQNNINLMGTKMFDQDKEGSAKYAKAALALFPDQTKFEAALQNIALAHGLTPEQRDMYAAQTSLEAFTKIKRVLHASH